MEPAVKKPGLSVAAPGYRDRLFVIVAAAALGPIVPIVLPTHASKLVAVVTLTNQLKFVPAKLTVKAGDTVQWRNVSVLVHTVTDDPKLAAKDVDSTLPKGAKPFNSSNLKPKGAFEHTFTVPGTYKYFCIPHEAAGMVAEVVVK